MTRRNFLLTVLGIGAIAKTYKTESGATWHHHQLTLYGDELRLYIDGKRTELKDAPTIFGKPVKQSLNGIWVQYE